MKFVAMLLIVLLIGTSQGNEVRLYTNYIKADNGHLNNDVLSLSFGVFDDNGEAIALNGRFSISVSSQREAIDSEATHIRTGSYDLNGRINSSEFIKTVKTIPNFKADGKKISVTAIRTPMYNISANDFYMGKINSTTGYLDRVKKYPWEDGTIVLDFYDENGKHIGADIQSIQFRDRKSNELFTIPRDGQVIISNVKHIKK